MHSTYFKNNSSTDSKDIAEPLCQLCCHGPCPHSNLWCGSLCPQQILTPFMFKKDIHGIFSRGRCIEKDLIFHLQNVFLWGFQVGPVWRDYEARLDLQTWSTKNSMSSLFYKKIMITSSHFFVFTKLDSHIVMHPSYDSKKQNRGWKELNLARNILGLFIHFLFRHQGSSSETWLHVNLTNIWKEYSKCKIE